MNRPLFPDVIVNGETIPQADIAAEAQQHEAQLESQVSRGALLQKLWLSVVCFYKKPAIEA
jgi:hypothetical protein